jgi:hypothetical protein
MIDSMIKCTNSNIFRVLGAQKYRMLFPIKAQTQNLIFGKNGKTFFSLFLVSSHVFGTATHGVEI